MVNRFHTSTAVLVLTVFLGLTAVTVLTSFQTDSKTINQNEIIGTYYKYTLEESYVIRQELTIKKNLKYKEVATYLCNGSNNKCNSQGFWSVKQDTVILIPTKQQWEILEVEKTNYKNNNLGYTFLADTLFYNDNALWRYNHQTKKRDRVYRKK